MTHRTAVAHTGELFRRTSAESVASWAAGLGWVSTTHRTFCKKVIYCPFFNSIHSTGHFIHRLHIYCPAVLLFRLAHQSGQVLATGQAVKCRFAVRMAFPLQCFVSVAKLERSEGGRYYVSAHRCSLLATEKTCGSTSRGEDDPNMKDSPKKVRTAADGQHRNTSQPSIRCCLNKLYMCDISFAKKRILN